MEDLTIAAVCMHSEPGKIDENLARMAGFVREGAQRGADLLCFPELSLTGYSLDRRPGSIPWMEVPEAVSILTPLAVDSRVTLMVGFCEWSGEDGPYITQVVVGPEGLIGSHRKTHLSPHEKDLYRAGETIDTLSFCGMTCGIQLCYESHFPEISTRMALQGADVLFFPHASPRGGGNQKLESWLRHLPARAFDNGLFVVAWNQVGETGVGFSFPGAAVVIAPDGRVMAKYTGEREDMLVVRLEAGLLKGIREQRMKYFIPHRRPSLYKLT
jgi:predicted amidohydrolase